MQHGSECMHIVCSVSVNNGDNIFCCIKWGAVDGGHMWVKRVVSAGIKWTQIPHPYPRNINKETAFTLSLCRDGEVLSCAYPLLLSCLVLGTGEESSCWSASQLFLGLICWAVWGVGVGFEFRCSVGLMAFRWGPRLGLGQLLCDNNLPQMLHKNANRLLL